MKPEALQFKNCWTKGKNVFILSRKKEHKKLKA